LFYHKDLFSNLHGVYESLRDVGRLLGWSALALIAIEIAWALEGDEWCSGHCNGVESVAPKYWLTPCSLLGEVWYVGFPKVDYE